METVARRGAKTFGFNAKLFSPGVTRFFETQETNTFSRLSDGRPFEISLFAISDDQQIAFQGCTVGCDFDDYALVIT